MEHLDVIVIGSGTAGYTAAHACRRAGRDVMVVDKQPFGGVCAMRGCQPKKILVAAAQAVHGALALQGQGVSGRASLDWTSLMRFKRDFTDAVPHNSEKSFLQAGMRTMHGQAVFTAPNRIHVNSKEFSAKHILVAAGAVPRRLDVPGSEWLMTSDDFLELDALPGSIVFLGGGFISFEFAHICVQGGVRTAIAHRGNTFLRQFDPDMVAQLMDAGQSQGIAFHPEVQLERVEKRGQELALHFSPDTDGPIVVDKAVSAVGRTPDLDGLDLATAEVDFSQGGVKVNAFMQSVSNPAVYAVGDAANTPFALATTADMEAETAAANILQGNTIQADHHAVPSVVFGIPPLAGVGMSEVQARALAAEQGFELAVNSGDATGWMTSRRIGQKHAAYKVILNKSTGAVLGAHLLGHNAEEMINIFALAIKCNLTRDQLKSVLWSYPTHVSDIKYML